MVIAQLIFAIYAYINYRKSQSKESEWENKVKSKSYNDAYIQGCQAFYQGYSSNPYPTDQEENKAWLDGYTAVLEK